MENHYIFSMGKSTISMAIFNSYLWFTRGYHVLPVPIFVDRPAVVYLLAKHAIRKCLDQQSVGNLMTYPLVNGNSKILKWRYCTI